MHKFNTKLNSKYNMLMHGRGTKVSFIIASNPKPIPKIRFSE